MNTFQEQQCKSLPGLPILISSILLTIGSIAAIIFFAIKGELFITLGFILLFVLCIFLFVGIKIVKPNEAYVFTLFGTYYGTLKKEGIHFVNPFLTSFNPLHKEIVVQKAPGQGVPINNKISMKMMTLNNEKQKINDLLGNPIIIGIIVIWRIENTAQACFGVDNYLEYLSTQADSSIRNIVRMYPYDVSSDGEEKSLRGSSQEIAEKLKEEIQERAANAGIEILDARITTLAYAPEIAQVMLQRQQASAIIDARKMIVEGAVSMVDMALTKLNEQNVVNLNEEQKAKMVANLLVVLCGNKDAQPTISSDSLQ